MAGSCDVSSLCASPRTRTRLCTGTLRVLNVFRTNGRSVPPAAAAAVPPATAEEAVLSSTALALARLRLLSGDNETQTHVYEPIDKRDHGYVRNASMDGMPLRHTICRD